jgi:hypothetical protein
MLHGLAGAFLLGVVFGAPWIAGAAWLWRKTVDDGTAFPSLAETVQRRRAGL